MLKVRRSQFVCMIDLKESLVSEGQWRRCLQGKYRGMGVVVKIFKKIGDREALNELLAHASILLSMRKHQNIIQCIGANFAGHAESRSLFASPIVLANFRTRHSEILI